VAIGALSSDAVATRETVLNFKPRGRRILPLCVVASVVLHSVVLVLFPGFALEHSVPSVRVLDVRLLAAAPPAIAPVMPAQSAAGRSRGAQPPTDAAAAGALRAPATPAADLHGAEAVAQMGADLAAPPPGLHSGDDGPGPDPTPAAPRGDSPVNLKAAYLHNPSPAYPSLARRNGEQGTVTLRVLVTRDGAPASVSVERSSGHARLDRSALEAVRAWRFVPAREQGEPVEVWMLVPIAFTLEGAY
jgi:periplasmic protein TonB